MTTDNASAVALDPRVEAACQAFLGFVDTPDTPWPTISDKDNEDMRAAMRVTLAAADAAAPSRDAHALQLVRYALIFAQEAGGEGIVIRGGPSPEDFLYEYGCETGDIDYGMAFTEAFADRVIARVLAASLSPWRTIEEAPAGWAYEFHEFGDVWSRHIILNRPDGGGNPPTKHCGSEVRNVRPVYFTPLPPLPQKEGE